MKLQLKSQLEVEVVNSDRSSEQEHSSIISIELAQRVPYLMLKGNPGTIMNFRGLSWSQRHQMKGTLEGLIPNLDSTRMLDIQAVLNSNWRRKFVQKQDSLGYRCWLSPCYPQWGRDCLNLLIDLRQQVLPSTLQGRFAKDWAALWAHWTLQRLALVQALVYCRPLGVDLARECLSSFLVNPLCLDIP